jgi:hypothetical protein
LDSDYSKFYSEMRLETGTPGPGFSSLQGVRWKWQDDPELGCGGTTCSKRVRVLAKPVVSGWVDEKNASYYPHFDPYTTYSTPPRPLTLAVFCPPFRAPPERLGTWVGRYVGWWESLLTLPPERLTDPEVIVMESFHVDMPAADVGDWRYASVLPSSLSQGLLISRFSLATGQFTGFYKSGFSMAGDIIDVLDYAFVQISRAVPPHDLPLDEVGLFESAHPELWVFGGKDIDGPRNDLWRGVALQSDIDGEVIYSWMKVDIPAGQFEPPGFAGSAMFYDPQQDRLVVWGGESASGPSNNIYYYNISTGTWSEGNAWGERPPRLSNTISAQSGHLGYIWGGNDENGYLSSDLYLLDLSEMRFHQIRVGGIQPPQLNNASLWVDPSNYRIYLYGGHDGDLYHNWVWSYTIGEGSWKLAVPDCTQGVCPDLTDDPLLFSFNPTSMLAVVPGTRFSEPLSEYVEHFFLQQGAVWKKQSDFLSSPADSADCDGDGVSEENYGMLCAGADWWDIPGEHVCDVPSQALVCSAQTAAPLEVSRTPTRGARAFVISNHNLLYTRGSSLYSVDTSDAGSFISLDEMHLGDSGGDIDLQGDIAAVAADESLVFVDVSDPSLLTEVSSIGACGRVMGVEYADDHLYYITRVGIGDVDVSDPTSPQLVRFSWIIPSTGGDWEIIDFDVSACSSLYTLEEAECDETDGCLGSGSRPFQVAGARAFFAFHKNLVKVDISQTDFTTDGTIDLGRRVESLLYEDGYIYLNLVGHRTQVIDVWAATPEVVGTHDLIELVAGVQYEGGRSLKLDNGSFWIATLP